MKEILFKSKDVNNIGWFYGFYWYSEKRNQHFILGESEDYGHQEIEIIPETVSQFTGLYCTNNKNSKIFQNDIVEITLHSGTKYRYLIWFCQEVCEVTVIDIQYIEFNGYDYHGNDMSIGEFSVMLQDHYGHNKEVKVIGNVFDNIELLQRKDN